MHIRPACTHSFIAHSGVVELTHDDKVSPGRLLSKVAIAEIPVYDRSY